ncbi:uncharacterized protein SPPG_08758 [Spizellomyces punctatus DAOM BR117]|uniref:Uncharacterized protein n=1 Tax=Spizellomyces punctatus (strain DAOM BR117) TaxID=645134 RepID=A0A0L0H514_SPIPD|nr:uncharacterized protein SPPG_08758 [Spizellomyces punctatus DAOM BR117]KNC95818.1 hypothetical protein SPPG_08758 [Spizellomyces punctatus DAOM BR117]|eukprot:XP_016603858.1 hypothetical protein SPPG_08758 [Spizellomyces punctatus DAOM BR117]
MSMFFTRRSRSPVLPLFSSSSSTSHSTSSSQEQTAVEMVDMSFVHKSHTAGYLLEDASPTPDTASDDSFLSTTSSYMSDIHVDEIEDGLPNVIRERSLPSPPSKRRVIQSLKGVFGMM